MIEPVVDAGGFVVGLFSSVSAVFFEAFNSALAFNSFLIFKSELFILFNAWYWYYYREGGLTTEMG